MIEKYLKDLDEFIAASPAIIDIAIIRRDICNTGLEKIALYRYRLKLKDGSLVEITERIIEEGGKLETTKYRFHWQDQSGNLIKRWDNAPHHPEIDTFPNHVHFNDDESVERFKQTDILTILKGVIATSNVTIIRPL